MIKVQASVSKGWLHREGGFVFDRRYYADPYHRMLQDRLCDEFIRRRFPRYPLYNMEDNLVQAEYVIPGQILVGAIQPNMIIAAALGAEFVYSPDRDSDIQGTPLNAVTDPSRLPAAESILEREFVLGLDRAFDEAARRYPGHRLIPPFFWDASGRGTIHGLITTSHKLIGSDVFFKMMLEPELVLGIHQWITDVYAVVLRHFSDKGGLPIRLVHVGECSGTLLSADMYRRFAVPFISRLGREFGGIRLHSCGRAEHILDAIMEIENLTSIDTGSGTSIAPIRGRLGPGFEISVFPPLEAVVHGAPPQKMKDWLDRTLDENGGGNLKIEYHIEPDYEEANCLAINEELERRGLYENSRLY